MNFKSIITNGVIAVLLVLNILMIALTIDSTKPRCVVDNCGRARCEKSFYCKDHDIAPHVNKHTYEVKLNYGKR